jgi:hypothetical protein
LRILPMLIKRINGRTGAALALQYGATPSHMVPL